MRLPEEPEQPAQIQIVPMIDVIFAVLTFFIMSSLFLTRSQGLPVNLPGAQSSQSQPSQEWVVTLDAAGNLSLNRQPMSLEALQVEMQKQVTTGQQPLVIINADQAVNHGKVVAVMDRLRTVPGVRLAIATRKP
ncbi:MAG TPA: biopolymer transporter ExbD [Synechococcales cyanobacterium M55_K2018_004]|nr:biopolymer transporter ExbD [Synechococcales cyanobacterium M55_K2018_004]